MKWSYCFRLFHHHLKQHSPPKVSVLRRNRILSWSNSVGVLKLTTYDRHLHACFRTQVDYAINTGNSAVQNTSKTMMDSIHGGFAHFVRSSTTRKNTRKQQSGHFFCTCTSRCMQIECCAHRLGIASLRDLATATRAML